MAAEGRGAGGRIGRNPPTDLIGRRGEIAFERAIISDVSGDALFWPAFLGEKWPAIDFYVQLLRAPVGTPYFFAQVKSTTVALRPAATHLRISVDREKLARMYELPGPTYLVGVHEPTGRAFILSIHRRPSRGVYRIPLSHELTPANLDTLHREVCAFWRSVPSKPAVSFFV